MPDWATHADVDRVRDQLTRDLRDTERILRDRDDEKERTLRAEFVAAVEGSEERLSARFDHVEEVLTEQNKWIMRSRFRWSTWRRDTLALLVSGILAALGLHYGFHIG